MRIHSISKVLVFPVFLLALCILGWGWYTGEKLSIYVILPATILVFLYVLHGPIDHWWLARFPIPFDPMLKEWLNRYFPPYKEMDQETQNKFEYRLGLYLDGRLFQSIGSERRDVPEDIKCMVAAHAVHMFLGKDDYLIGNIDRIFLYKHPFPSPDFPFFHNVEVNTEDGVIILSIEQLKNAIINPTGYYNTAYHAYAEAFIFTQKNILYPDITDSWDALEKVSGWSKSLFQIQTGFDNLPLLPIHISLFFSKPKEYQAVLPQNYQKMVIIFNQKS